MAGSSIKFSVLIPSRPSDEELLFVRQIGVDYVYTYVGADSSDVKSLTELRLRVEDAGLTLYDVANPALVRSERYSWPFPAETTRSVSSRALSATWAARVSMR